MGLAELGGMLFIYMVLFFVPAYLLFIFGGWPCVGIFVGANALQFIASKATEWR